MALSNRDKENEPPLNESDLDLLRGSARSRESLEAFSFFFRQPVAPITLEDQSKLAGIRDLVQISQQLGAKERGEPHSPIVVENEEVLRRAAVAKFSVEDASSAVATDVSSAPSQTASAPVPDEGRETSEITQPIEDVPVAKLHCAFRLSRQRLCFGCRHGPSLRAHNPGTLNALLHRWMQGSLAQLPGLALRRVWVRLPIS